MLSWSNAVMEHLGVKTLADRQAEAEEQARIRAEENKRIEEAANRFLTIMLSILAIIGLPAIAIILIRSHRQEKAERVKYLDDSLGLRTQAQELTDNYLADLPQVRKELNASKGKFYEGDWHDANGQLGNLPDQFKKHLAEMKQVQVSSGMKLWEIRSSFQKLVDLYQRIEVLKPESLLLNLARKQEQRAEAKDTATKLFSSLPLKFESAGKDEWAKKRPEQVNQAREGFQAAKGASNGQNVCWLTVLKLLNEASSTLDEAMAVPPPPPVRRSYATTNYGSSSRRNDDFSGGFSGSGGGGIGGGGFGGGRSGGGGASGKW